MYDRRAGYGTRASYSRKLAHDGLGVGGCHLERLAAAARPCRSLPVKVLVLWVDERQYLYGEGVVFEIEDISRLDLIAQGQGCDLLRKSRLQRLVPRNHLAITPITRLGKA